MVEREWLRPEEAAQRRDGTVGQHRGPQVQGEQGQPREREQVQTLPGAGRVRRETQETGSHRQGEKGDQFHGRNSLTDLLSQRGG